MKTQIERIKNAEIAYIMPLNNIFTRFQVYLFEDGQLECIWPEDAINKKHATLLPNQIYSRMHNYPAFHFVCTFGMDHQNEIALAFKAINPKLKIYALNGASPSVLGI